MRPFPLAIVVTLLVPVLFATAPRPALGQTITAEGPVVYGHHHFNTTDMAAQRRFFVDTLGGKAATIGTNNTEVIEFPNVFLFFRPMQKPTGGTIGSTVNHVGFSVPDLKPVVAKLKANGYKMITQRIGSRDREDHRRHRRREPDDEHRVHAGPGRHQGRARRSQVAGSCRSSCTTCTSSASTATRCRRGTRRCSARRSCRLRPTQAFVTDQLPGVALSFSPSATPTVATHGRALDHIGFEIKNLEAFTKKLEASGIPLTVRIAR